MGVKNVRLELRRAGCMNPDESFPTGCQTKQMLPNCRIPDDWIDTKRYALFMARDVMRALIDQMQSASVPSSS